MEGGFEIVLEVKYILKIDTTSIQKLPQNDIENKVGFRISFWFDFGSLLEGLEGQSRPKYLIDFELIFDRVSGWGVCDGSSPLPRGYFLVSQPL